MGRYTISSLNPKKALHYLQLIIRQNSLPSGELYISHEDVEPIALFPVNKSNGEIVYQQLEDTIEKTGVPREIVSDHGSDVKAGIEQFCQKHEHTCFIYDIKHKVATILKPIPVNEIHAAF